jgi:hypothetical protein
VDVLDLLSLGLKLLQRCAPEFLRLAQYAERILQRVFDGIMCGLRLLQVIIVAGTERGRGGRI